MKYIESLIFNIVFAFFAYMVYKNASVGFQFTFAYILGAIAYGFTDLFKGNNK